MPSYCDNENNTVGTILMSLPSGGGCSCSCSNKNKQNDKFSLFDDLVNESSGFYRRPLIFKRCSRSRFVIYGFFDGTEQDQVLSAQRVNQMTKVYYDIDAATLLLEERERDLELAARIGQSLLERNNELNSRNDVLEQRLGTLNDIVAQLHHKLELKSDLLAFYTQALDSVEDEEDRHDESSSPPLYSSSGSTIRRDSDEKVSCSVSVQCDNGLFVGDNSILQTCLKQLTFLSDEVDRLTAEVATKTCEVLRQQNEIESLTSHIFNLQTTLAQSDDENMRMGERLEEATDAQSLLANEVGGLKARYDECLDLLREAQQEIRALKKRQRSCRPIVHYFTPSTEQNRLETGFDTSFSTNSTPNRQSSTAPNTLLMAAAQKSGSGGETPSFSACSCRGAPQRRISSDCDSDPGYAADSDSMLAESLVCSPNTANSNSLSVRTTLSPCLSSTSASSSSNCDPATPKLQKSPNGLSNRVKIVKPLEGSVTMHRWASLAHTTLSSSALDSLPGVMSKEPDPVSDIPLHRRGDHQPVEPSPSLHIVVNGPESGISSLTFEDYDDPAFSFNGMASPLPLNSRPAVFLLDDEEELYGDFEIVESRLVSARSEDSTRPASVQSQEAYVPTMTQQQEPPTCCLEICGISVETFNRLKGIHRHKGQQGLNLSPPTLSTSPTNASRSNSSTKGLMTRPFTLPETTANSSQTQEEEQAEATPTRMRLSFYHPSQDGPFTLTSSFLPKYRNFLLKHRLSQTTWDNNANSSSSDLTNQQKIDEDLDESLEEGETELQQK